MSQSNHQTDAWRALVSHALTAEEAESNKRQPVLVKKRTSAALRMPVISAESRTQYEYELTERAGHYVDAGVSEAEADALALNDLGCVEFWDWFTDTQLEPLRQAA